MSTEEKNFYNYVVIQFSGAFNMITEGSIVSKIMGVSYDEYWDIILKKKKKKNKYAESYEKARKQGELKSKEIWGE